MTEYAVHVTDTAFQAIADHARYIAIENDAPINAQRWLERIWDAVETLEQTPRRAAKALENIYVGLEVRQLVVGDHLILFTVDDDRQTVWILGLRHGHRLPRPNELPQNPESLEADRGDE